MNVGTGSSNLEKFETRNFEIIKNVYKFLEYRNNPSYTNICVFNQKELHIYIIIKNAVPNHVERYRNLPQPETLINRGFE